MAGRAERPLARGRAFWDSSALVPLCVHQSRTPAVSVLYQRYQAIVWWGTPVEIASALARLLRMKLINSSDWTKSSQIATSLADEWFAVQPSNQLRARAIRLLDRHNLRAADALQLAAAVEWCEGTPEGNKFLAADEKLCGAAENLGFDVQEI
jgi:uncharacterized protein